MSTNLESAFNKLPVWMIFIALLLMILTPIIMEVIRIIRFKREFKINNDFIEEIKIYQVKLYNSLNILLDVLYEKFANNVTLDISCKIIEAIYMRSSYSIIEYILLQIKEQDLTGDNSIDIERITDEFTGFVSNRYYSDNMLLDKIKCKGIPLNVHMTNQINPIEVSKKILSFIEGINETRKNKKILLGKICMYKEISKRINSYFNTLSSKGQTYIENQVKKFNIVQNE